MHIVDAAEQLWVQQRLESVRCHPEYGDDVKKMILERLTAAEGLERYLQNKFPGTKRFGLEGGESLIPMLHEAIQRAGSHGVVEMVIAMAHRGRLNVLVNILGKHPRELFDEFEGKLPDTQVSGDVKYHQGFSSNVMTPGGEIHLALAFNPSHLEIVGPVAEGSVRARQDRRTDYTGNLVVPILIHGDAAFAGQGVVMETFQMSQTRGFKTGGTIHVIINNQIGFTTSRQDDARSTEYCTEVARMVQAPIFHVNGDDPEEVLFVTQVAIDYRMQFRKDVVIDLVRLSTSRPQRSRRADDDTAVDVSAHSQADDDADDLRGKARSRWHDHAGRSRPDGRNVSSRARFRGTRCAESRIETEHRSIRRLGAVSRPPLDNAGRYAFSARGSAQARHADGAATGRVRAASAGAATRRRPPQDDGGCVCR